MAAKNETYSRVKMCAYLSASQDDLSGHEDEEYDFRFDHTVDQTGEQLRQINVNNVARMLLGGIQTSGS